MKIGIIGAGYVGRSLAGAGVKAGHEVMISNSRGPQTLFSECAVIACKAGTIDEAARFGDIVVVAITMKHHKAVPVEPLEGKIVIDTNNYYPGRDDAIPELNSRETTSSEMLARHLPDSKVVKAFNAILMPHFDRDGQPTGSFDRRALPFAGDDADAKKVVSDLHDQFGFAPIDVGPLSEGWRFQPGTPVYCIRFNGAWIKRALAEATRSILAENTSVRFRSSGVTKRTVAAGRYATFRALRSSARRKTRAASGRCVGGQGFRPSPL